MNTKTFAQQSRNLLIDGVAKKLLYWGFDTNGTILEQPNKLSGGYTFRGEVFDDANVPQLWESLKHAVQHKGIEVVVEEAAYTWFNRMMALRIMVKNGYEQPQLENVTGMEHTPEILQKARQGYYGFLNKVEQERLKKIIGDYSKDQEAFALLLVGYCHANKTLDKVFGKLDDYTELLLPDNMLQDSGFLHLLNTTDAISDDEYQQVELIGWLYQFYISEKKDEVFASFKKNKKAEAKDIPAATQIFTPNWIVKYMVENTAGKIWLDKHPDSKLKSQMKYLVENESDATSEAIINNVEELTLIDPAAGSGHILVEGFELLYQMYMEEYYTPEEAVESILKNNLIGLDIDDRAAQLATFAILLKAAKKYRDIWYKDWLPNVYAMPEAQDFNLQEVKDFLGAEGIDYAEELEVALRLMKQGKNLGSVMKLNISEASRTFIEKRFIELENTEYRDFNIEAIYQNLKPYIPVLLILTKKYTSVVANPPYMGQSSMNAGVKNYVNINYRISKADLMTVFIEVIGQMLAINGRSGIVTLDSWMLNKTFKKLRLKMLDSFPFESLVHVGWNCFPEGHLYNRGVAWTSLKTRSKLQGAFINLENVPATIDKHELFLTRNDQGNENFYLKSNGSFLDLPDNVISYWLSLAVENIFNTVSPLSHYGDAKVGLQTGNNNRFRRDWQEVSFKKSSISNTDAAKWFPYNSGGDYRKWYGNQYYFVNWENDGDEIISTKPKSVIRNKDYYFRESISWSKVTSSGISLRYFPEGFIFDVAGCSIFSSEIQIKGLLGLLNSKLSKPLIKSLSQTINYEVGQLSHAPVKKELFSNVDIKKLVESCIEVSKRDWNRKEVSWNFEQSPLINESSDTELAFQNWEEKVSLDFFQLHAIEEELNRIFIDIYGLQEELTPEVALKDITILQEELNKNDLVALEDEFRANGAETIELPIDKGEVISQFISYAIGLFMGRYRLDKPGLNISHPNPTAEELASYSYNNGQVIIDEDAILPLIGKNCNFPDDALQQFQHLLDTIWSHETRTENINFIQDCLDKDLEKFLIKDFYKYHCKMYKKKPIYWLFASPKGAFQVLVYMHRMNAFTVEKIRANYLLEHIKNINSEIMVLEGNASNLNTQEAKRLDTLRVDLRECETYDMELKNVADQQISFDLDDGVTVNYKKFETVVAKIK